MSAVTPIYWLDQMLLYNLHSPMPSEIIICLLFFFNSIQYYCIIILVDKAYILGGSYNVRILHKLLPY